MKIAFFYNKRKKNAEEIKESLKKWCIDEGHELLEEDKYKEQECELAIAAGGDGTFLRASSIIYKDNIPILGINLGGLGFLTDVRKEEFKSILNKISNKNYTLQERMLLNVKYDDKSDNALNDVVVSMTEGRMIHLNISINGEFVTDLAGDGLIVSTPTGSTAYSLASGGPILTPTTSGIVITPISPHTLSFRPIVIGSESTITIETGDPSLLVCDGQRKTILKEEKHVVIEKSRHSLKLIKIKDKNFFDILRNKLHWGNR